VIDGLREYCLQQSGVEESLSCGEANPSYILIRGPGYTDFARFRLDEGPPLLLVRCADDALQALGARHGGQIKKSEHMDWRTEGWTWAQAPLDGSVPQVVLRQLIDASYAMVYGPLDDVDRRFIALRDRRPTMELALEELIDLHRLRHRRDDILKLRQPAIRLVTRARAQDDFVLGQSRLGGLPDLPEPWSWPAFADKPMAFLAQINLAEIPADVRLEPLPATGILYVFSMLARQHEDGDDDNDRNEGSDDPGLSQILYFDEDVAVLTRRLRPRGLRTFDTVAITYESKVSLPSTNRYTRDPHTDWLQWPMEERERMADLEGDLGYLYSRHVGNRADHLLLGYAGSIQNAVARPGERLLLQIDSDDNAGMMWGDGGTIYFVITPEALEERRFSAVRSDKQCG
jgi:predicted DNA-binding protein (MmcQ/YjbR family)